MQLHGICITAVYVRKILRTESYDRTAYDFCIVLGKPPFKMIAVDVAAALDRSGTTLVRYKTSVF